MNLSPRKLISNFAATIIYCICLFIITFTVSSGAGSWLRIPHSDKIFHFFEFGGLGFLLFCSISRTVNSSRLKIFLYVVVIGAVVGICDEFFFQSLIPHRVVSIFDFIADLAGIIAGAAIAKRVTRIDTVTPSSP